MNILQRSVNKVFGIMKGAWPVAFVLFAAGFLSLGYNLRGPAVVIQPLEKNATPTSVAVTLKPSASPTTPIKNLSSPTPSPKSSAVEVQQPYVAPPTPDQIANLRRFCLADVDIKAICDEPNFMPAYYSNVIFRAEIGKIIVRYYAILSDQERQSIIAEKRTLDCIMAPTPEDERVLDPATQNYLRQVRCGTVTDVDKTSYELSRIRSSVDELKYRLDSKISFPAFYLDPIKAPTFSNPQWQIRWEGSGGTVTDSSGNFYQFRCEDDTCRSY